MLSGPAGAGKSTTVQSLAKSHGAQIIEWINPVDELKLASQTDGFYIPNVLLISRNSIVVEEILYVSTEFATVHVFGIGGTSNRLDPGSSEHNWIVYIYGTSASPFPDFVARISQFVSCTISSCAHRH